MAFSPHSTSELQSEINVTPLVDVMLVLLVVFIVTAPLLTNAVPVNLPKTAATAPPDTQQPLVVSIDDNGQLFVAQTPLALEQLESRLLAARSENERLQVQLRASETVNYGLVAKSLVSIERAGISKVAIVTAR